MTRRFVPADRRDLWRDLVREARAARDLGTRTLTQVALDRDGARVVAWIRSDLARVGVSVTIEGEPGVWSVTETYASRPAETDEGCVVCVYFG